MNKNQKILVALVGTSAAFVANACVMISKQDSKLRASRGRKSACEKIVDTYLNDPKQFRAVVNDAVIDVKFWDIIADLKR